MKLKRESVDYIKDISEAVSKIEQFTQGIKYHDFVKDEKTVFAVLRAFEIIGEATKNVSKSIKTKYANVPWREMTGIRNKLIHEYFGVINQVIWKTLKEDIPPLKPKIEQILQDLNKEKSSPSNAL